MKILSYIPDFRIKACNVCVELTAKEYILIANDVINKNDFQRKKVISSAIKKTLKEDIRQRCTIPSIVLGIKEEVLPLGFDFEQFQNDTLIEECFEKKEVIILDGLQRTFVLIELFEENPQADWLDSLIRCEIYVGVQKLGILYRMLTLNTGQTTMATRHLLEILFFDYLDIDLEGVKLLLDKNSETVENPLAEYNFKEVIEGYNSFIEGKEVPLLRADVLQNIETLSNLEKTDDEKEGFKAFLILYKTLLNKFETLFVGFQYDVDQAKGSEFEIQANPFGRTSVTVFGKSQSLTGLGAALYFLKKNRNRSFGEISRDIESLTVEDNNDLSYLIKHFDYIRNRSKKVGNDQRYYFKIFYQSLFDAESEETFKDFKKSIVKAYTRVQERLEDE